MGTVFFCSCTFSYGAYSNQTVLLYCTHFSTAVEWLLVLKYGGKWWIF